MGDMSAEYDPNVKAPYQSDTPSVESSTSNSRSLVEADNDGLLPFIPWGIPDSC